MCIKLKRAVALKSLPEELLKEPSALERFEREAQAASALNHPGICTIFDIDEHEGRHFIAMELLEGRTLKQRLVGRPLPADEIVNLAVQIADALTESRSTFTGLLIGPTRFGPSRLTAARQGPSPP